MRLDGRGVGYLFWQPTCLGLLSFWLWVLLGVRMLCCLETLGRKSCFQVSLTCHELSRCPVGSTIALCLPQRRSQNIVL